MDGAGEAVSEEQERKRNDTIEEQSQIDLVIASYLGCIHVVQPCSFMCLSLVVMIEVLRQSLVDERALKHSVAETNKEPSARFGRRQKGNEATLTNAAKQQEPPTLI